MLLEIKYFDTTVTSNTSSFGKLWRLVGTLYLVPSRVAKTNALKISNGCFDTIMVLSPRAITDVQWCYNKINCSKNNITKGETVTEISSDASSFG